MTHVTGNTQPITSTTYAWQYLTQEEVSRLKYDSSSDSMTLMTGGTPPITSAVHRGADCRLSRNTGRERNYADCPVRSPGARLGACFHGLSVGQCFRFGRNRRLGECGEWRCGPSSDRGCACSTDEGSGSAAHRGADCRRHRTQVWEEFVESAQIISQKRISDRIIEYCP